MTLRVVFPDDRIVKELRSNTRGRKEGFLDGCNTDVFVPKEGINFSNGVPETIAVQLQDDGQRRRHRRCRPWVGMDATSEQKQEDESTRKFTIYRWTGM